MREKIVEIPQSKIDEMKYYYDPLVAGICIQKYMETEDGKGDFIPVYANKAFAESMGMPIDLIYQFSLRQASREFPEKQLQDMVEVAFDGRIINGDSFSKDYSRYFTVRIYQYAYGYTIMFMADATSVHIASNTLQSVSRAYESIYYARLQEPVCSRVYPSSEEGMSGKTYEDLISDIVVENNVCQEDRFIVENFFKRENIKRSVFVDDVASLRFRCSFENGSYRWYSAEVIVNERSLFEPEAFVITIKDINDIVKEEKQKQKDLEQAYNEVKRANESKNRFLANMSHDIRTPINGILGILQLLDDNNLSRELIEEYKGTVKAQAEHLLTMLTDVLDITRLDSDDIQLELSDIDLYNVKNQFEIFGERTNTRITLDFGEIKHPYRRGCESYLRQIVLKLFSNATKFNKNDSPIEITFREVEGSDHIIFTIRDHGVGISDEFKAHIFEPFSQEHSSARTTYEGSGVGLTYVKRIVDALNGTIDFDSKVDEGTVFKIEIPLEIDFEKEKQSSITQDTINLEGKRGLIVEDNEINMLIAECFLDRAKMTSVKALNGKIGLEKFLESQEGEYDFILMDVMMPVMNGLEATKAIRESNHPQASTIPIIGVSANYFPEDISRGINSGMTDYLSKPINRRMLLETIAKHTQ